MQGEAGDGGGSGLGARSAVGVASGRGAARTITRFRNLQTTTLGNATKRWTRKLTAAFSSDVEAAVLKATKPKYTAPKEKYVLTLLAATNGCGELFFTSLAEATGSAEGATTGGALNRSVSGGSKNGDGGGGGQGKRIAAVNPSGKPHYGLNKVSTFTLQRHAHAPMHAPLDEAEQPSYGERVLLCGDIVRKLWRHGAERDWRIVSKVLMVVHRMMRDAGEYADSVVFKLWSIKYDSLARNHHSIGSETGAAVAYAQRPMPLPLEWLDRLEMRSALAAPNVPRNVSARYGGSGTLPHESHANPSAQHYHTMCLSQLAESFRDESRTRPEAALCSRLVRAYAHYVAARLDAFRLLYLRDRTDNMLTACVTDPEGFALDDEEECGGDGGDKRVDETGVVSNALGEELRERPSFRRSLREVLPVLLQLIELATAVNLHSLSAEEAAEHASPARVDSSASMERSRSMRSGPLPVAPASMLNEITAEAIRLLVHDVMHLFTTASDLMEQILEQQVFLSGSSAALMRCCRQRYQQYVSTVQRVRDWLDVTSNGLLGVEEGADAAAPGVRKRVLGNAAAEAMLRGELDYVPVDLIDRGWWADSFALSERAPESPSERRGAPRSSPRRPEAGRVERGATRPPRPTQSTVPPAGTLRKARSLRELAAQGDGSDLSPDETTTAAMDANWRDIDDELRRLEVQFESERLALQRAYETRRAVLLTRKSQLHRVQHAHRHERRPSM
ncbi:hypothetical protein CDCA_CDCA03G0858 [Cyanidium caldarium]|uniref:ENTH domain-containing protein n=1 Tax=Cyanidium caldarium TaxID=2771 RepID=A0AAV9IS05_CYACA|nr:hypothetical protein CDCA_CDCA03G0858 [Cyanidium caldarium]